MIQLSYEYNISTKTLSGDVANNTSEVVVTEKKTQSNIKIKTIMKKKIEIKNFMWFG
jgi:hypothetical protein